MLCIGKVKRVPQSSVTRYPREFPMEASLSPSWYLQDALNVKRSKAMKRRPGNSCGLKTAHDAMLLFLKSLNFT